jgi:hypothetical protein
MARKRKGGGNRNKPTLEGNENHIDEFFAAYPSFNYDPTAPMTREFKRMCKFFGWSDDRRDKRDARDEFRAAMVRDFNSFYGSDVHDILAWHKLCRAVGICPLPEDIRECRKVRRFSSFPLLRQAPLVIGRMRELRIPAVEDEYRPRKLGTLLADKEAPKSKTESQGNTC